MSQRGVVLKGSNGQRRVVLNLIRPLTALLLLAAFSATAQEPAHQRMLQWSDLRAAIETAALAKPKNDGLVTALDGEAIEMSGFLLPVDRDGETVYSFLLVPWRGACSHTPAPPVNQAVLVTPTEPIVSPDIYQPVRIAGRISAKVETSQFYLFDGMATVTSGYGVTRASVVRLADLAEETPPSRVGPWTFLKPAD
jgi:hypothetical protein